MTAPRQLPLSGLPTSWKPREAPSEIILPGRLDGFIATPEEVEERERQDAERVEKANAHMDAVLQAMFVCRCCGQNAGPGVGLSGPCAAVVRRLRTEQAMAEEVGGRSRVELARMYVDRESAQEAS